MVKGRSVARLAADAQAVRPPPPRALAPLARQFWDQFTAAMPPSAFAAIDLPGLRRLCELSAWRFQLARQLDGLPIEARMAKDGVLLQRQVAELDRGILQHERALRLTAQSRQDAQTAARRARGQDGLFQGEEPAAARRNALLSGRLQ